MIGVIAQDIQHFQTKLITIRHALIDASGDGAVAADAGAAFMLGTEGKERFGERSAGPADTQETMGPSITALVRRRLLVDNLQQNLLRQDATIPTVSSRGPADVARGATVDATSASGRGHPEGALDVRRGQEKGSRIVTPAFSKLLLLRVTTVRE